MSNNRGTKSSIHLIDGPKKIAEAREKGQLINVSTTSSIKVNALSSIGNKTLSLIKNRAFKKDVAADTNTYVAVLGTMGGYPPLFGRLEAVESHLKQLGFSLAAAIQQHEVITSNNVEYSDNIQYEDGRVGPGWLFSDPEVQAKVDKIVETRTQYLSRNDKGKRVDTRFSNLIDLIQMEPSLKTKKTQEAYVSVIPNKESANDIANLKREVQNSLYMTKDGELPKLIIALDKNTIKVLDYNNVRSSVADPIVPVYNKEGDNRPIYILVPNNVDTFVHLLRKLQVHVGADVLSRSILDVYRWDQDYLRAFKEQGLSFIPGAQQVFQQQAPSVFGQSAFGQPAQQAPSVFGQPTQQAPSVFGQSAFGQQAPSMFAPRVPTGQTPPRVPTGQTPDWS